MTGKRPTEEELSGLLNASHFGDETAELPPGDPVTVVQLVLTLEQVKPYDRNPRRDRNPRFDEIKASIRAQRGLNTPLNVTKRPGDTLHMVEAGGNTRLQILQELWEETKDECFHHINAQYRPWVSESYVLTAHLVENELRGEMTLLDKSMGLQVLKAQLEEEAGTPLNRSEFVRKLKAVGYTVSRRQIIRMQYLADRLYPLIPTVAREGLVQREIDAIRDTEKAYLRFWSSRLGEDQVEQFHLAFGDVLSRHDDDWDFESVRTELDRQLSELSSLEVAQVRMEVDALLYGEQHTVSTASAIEPQQADTGTDAEDGDTSSSMDSKVSTAQPPTKPTTEADSSSDQKQPTPSKKSDSCASRKLDQYTGPSDLKSLRARNLVLALRIARRNDLSTCIRPINIGMGFLIDLPEAPFKVNDKGNGIGRDGERQFLWWMLLGACEVLHGSGQPWTLSNDRARLALTDEMRLLTPLRQAGIQGVIRTVGLPTPLEFVPYQLLSSPQGLDDNSFWDLLLLLENCRRIRVKVKDPGDMRLWETT
ncbi:MAG: hypothetical protein JMN27_15115 [gamma proteobacterium endosymbiont of Lamellibrachia anaximandri]|nr:hypothetical protein [gamma proteobacterium endosymbiont of Lamellibrachia anaximandri]MBL3535141.1 hypothetical protein [gamma proteobacterium endosymbiont of Lamellibrachia anaximandri]